MKQKLLLVAIFFLALVLRVYFLGSIPPSLYWDEASLGYNAYSISQTLHDEHGEYLPFSRFIAFGDYKAPGYIYIDALTIKILGLSEFSIRLPSALSGALLAVVASFLAAEIVFLVRQRNTSLPHLDLVPLVSAFVVAVSPWSLQLSRGAFEGNLATLFSSLGLLFFLIAMRVRKTIFYLLSSILFVASMYTFNSHRYFVPLLVGALSLLFLRKMIQNWEKSLLFFVVCGVLLLPLFSHVLLREGQLRFYEVTWLNDLAPIEKANRYALEDGDNVISKVLHNRRWEYVWQFAKHYTDHFNWDFLFIHGDVNPRLSSQGTGELYFFESLFLLAGLFVMLKIRGLGFGVIFAGILLGLVPAALARETPHALRTVNLLPLPQIVVALGIVYLFSKFRRSWFVPALVIVYFLSLTTSLHYYFVHYPKDYAIQWQYGYRELVSYLSSVEKNYDYINVSDFYGRPYIYFLLYEKISPEVFWKTGKTDRDWYGFWKVSGFGKYTFGLGEKQPGRGLSVVQAGTNVTKETPLKVIADPLGVPIFDIYKI